jgi:hypothetical protein
MDVSSSCDMHVSSSSYDMHALYLTAQDLLHVSSSSYNMHVSSSYDSMYPPPHITCMRFT